MSLLDAEEIRSALEELVDELVARGVRARIQVIGGAAMSLLYHHERLATRDVDAWFDEREAVLEAARAVASRRGYPDDWLNDRATGFFPLGIDLEPVTLIERDGVVVHVADAQHMLMMKLRAGRGRRDLEDIEVLLEVCGLQSVVEVEDLYERAYPDYELKPLARAAVLRYFEQSPA